MLTRSFFIRAFVVIFCIATGVGLIYAGPMNDYKYVEFHHCWLHLSLSVIGLISVIRLTAARIFLVVSSLIFFALSLCGFLSSDHCMNMGFNPMVNYIHLIVGAVLFSIGVFL